MPLVVIAFVVCGALDLLFALALHLWIGWLRERNKDQQSQGLPSLPIFFKPHPVIAIILAVLGVLTIAAGILLWSFDPVLSAG